MKRLFYSMFLMVFTLCANAFDFVVDGIYYNITSKSSLTCEVTYRDQNYDSYIGIVNIPSYVTYNGVDYKVVRIGSFAFCKSMNLTYINIPNTVTEIGEWAFANCAFTTITIPDEVQTIEERTFSGCRSMTSVKLGKGLKSIGSCAFIDCPALRSIDIPEGVTLIDDYAFDMCSSLTSVNISSTVEYIGRYAFIDCVSLESVVIPQGVKSINLSTFANCHALASVSLPNTVTSIDGNAFYGCDSLRTFTMPNSVEAIGEKAFSECNNLTSVTFSENLTKLSDYAFRYCTSLDSLVLPSRLTSIGYATFEDCDSLSFVSIPNSVTTIWHNAFSGCMSLKSVDIPKGVTTIYDGAFRNCSSLETITLPNSLTSIGENVFNGCWSLSNIYDYAVQPQDIASNTFCFYDTLHVLTGCKAAYDSLEVWNRFNIIEDIAVVKVQSIKFDKDAYHCCVNDMVAPVATCYPNNATIKDVEWACTGDSIIVVDKSTGHFIALAEGTTTITATATDGSGVTNSVSVFVEKAKDPELCARPSISYSNGNIQLECETAGAECHYSIDAEDHCSNVGTNIALSATYHITAYATAEGYSPSEVANATLIFKLNGEGTDVDKVFNVDATPVFVTCTGGVIVVSGLKDNSTIEVYSVDGKSLGNGSSSNGEARISTSQPKGTIIIVHIDNVGYKVIL